MSLGLAIAGAICALLLAIAVVVRPIWGLYPVIVANQFEYFVPLSEGLSVARIIGLVVGVGWLMNLAIRRRTKITLHKRLNAPMVLYLVVAAIGVVGAVSVQRGMVQLVKLCMLVFLAILVQDLISNRRDLKRLVWVIAMSYGLSSVAGFLQYREVLSGGRVIGDVVGAGSALRYAGLHDNPNAFGLMLMSGIPFLVLLILDARRWSLRAVYLGVFASAVFSLLLTVSRTHMLAFLVFMAVYVLTEYRSWFLRPRGIIVLVLVVAILGAVLSVAPTYVFERFSKLTPASDDSAAYRWLLLKKGFVLLGSHPLLGVGLKNFVFHRPHPGLDAHDTFGVVVGETGLLGSVVFLTFVVLVVARQRRVIRGLRRIGDPFLARLATVVHAAFVTYLAIAFGNIILYQRMFWVYFALTAVLSRPEAYRLLGPSPAPAEGTIRTRRLHPVEPRTGLVPR